MGGGARGGPDRGSLLSRRIDRRLLIERLLREVEQQRRLPGPPPRKAPPNETIITAQMAKRCLAPPQFRRWGQFWKKLGAEKLSVGAIRKVLTRDEQELFYAFLEQIIEAHQADGGAGLSSAGPDSNSP